MALLQDPLQKKDLVVDLYSSSALIADYDEMDLFDSSELFRLLNT
jgi:hypothetical protein